MKRAGLVYLLVRLCSSKSVRVSFARARHRCRGVDSSIGLKGTGSHRLSCLDSGAHVWLHTLVVYSSWRATQRMCNAALCVLFLVCKGKDSGEAAAARYSSDIHHRLSRTAISSLLFGWLSVQVHTSAGMLQSTCCSSDHLQL